MRKSVQLCYASNTIDDETRSRYVEGRVHYVDLDRAKRYVAPAKRNRLPDLPRDTVDSDDRSGRQPGRGQRGCTPPLAARGVYS